MPLKLAMIVLPPLIVIVVVLCVVGASWKDMAKVIVILVAILLVVGLCDRMTLLRSPWEPPAAEPMAAPPQASSAIGLGASAIASLPVYKYEKKSGGDGSDECSICLGEIKQKETVKQLPVCTHLFHEGCIDVWLRSHRTCPVCRSPVIVAVAPASMEIDVRHLDS